MKRIAVLSFFLFFGVSPAWSLTVFSSGMTLPESISQAPANFGGYGGDYLIPDANSHQVWRIPEAGGAPVSFADNIGAYDSNGFTTYSQILNGTFLPDGYGTVGGTFALVADALLGTLMGVTSSIQPSTR